MNADLRRELIPRAYALRLIEAIEAMKDRLLTAVEQCQLLDEDGRVPAAPSYTELLQHATDAKDLSRDVLRLAAGFARSPHHATRAGRTVLKHLGTAVTMSSRAVSSFAETAEGALALSRSANPTDRHYLANRMVIDHASARAFLRRASESLHAAATELDGHLGFQHFLAMLTRQEGPPVPPPPGPGGRHR